MSGPLTLVIALACKPTRYRIYSSPDAAREALGETKQDKGVTLVLPLDGFLDLTFLVEAITHAESVISDYETARSKGYIPHAKKTIYAAADQLRQWSRNPSTVEVSDETTS